MLVQSFEDLECYIFEVQALIIQKLNCAEPGTEEFLPLFDFLHKMQSIQLMLKYRVEYFTSTAAAKDTQRVSLHTNVAPLLSVRTFCLHGNACPTSKLGTEILRSWARAHLPHPFPSTDEKQSLAERTGLTIVHINHWFGNFRKRKWEQGIIALHEKEIFQLWADEHLAHPFPSASEKKRLAEQAGVTVLQVANWFANFRKRKWESKVMACLEAFIG
jgi:hypothetical protein